MTLCRIDRGTRRRFGTATSSQTTPTPDPGTVVVGSVGLASSVIESVSSGAAEALDRPAPSDIADR